MLICALSRIKILISVSFIICIMILCSVNVRANRCLPNSTGEPSLVDCLKSIITDSDVQYISALRDLNYDGIPEAIVYLMGNYCGSGGCNTLILAQDATSWKVIATITVSWPPIYVFNNSSNGWRDIGVFVGGGGIYPGYEAVLSFDGDSYPSNPTVAPSRQINENDTGENVIASRQGAVYLYGK